MSSQQQTTGGNSSVLLFFVMIMTPLPLSVLFSPRIFASIIIYFVVGPSCAPAVGSKQSRFARLARRLLPGPASLEGASAKGPELFVDPSRKGRNGGLGEMELEETDRHRRAQNRFEILFVTDINGG